MTTESQFEKKGTTGNWQQCGGINWTGATQCGLGYHCFKQNKWYSQCKPRTGGIVPSDADIIYILTLIEIKMCLIFPQNLNLEMLQATGNSVAG